MAAFRDDFAYDLLRIPFAGLLIPLVGGIFWQYKILPFDFDMLPLIFSLIIVALIFNVKFLRIRSSISGAVFFSIIFSVGCHTVQKLKTCSELPLGIPGTFEVVVNDNPTTKNGRLRFEADVTSLYDSVGNVIRCNEEILIYFSDTTATIRPGDVLICSATINAIPPPQNPGEFDYQTYMRRKGIFANAFVAEGNAMITDSGRIAFYRKYPLMFQKYASDAFIESGLTGEELGVATALTTGNKQYLDPETRETFTSSGAVHLLTVSGLHVGIIFVIFNFLLRFMNRDRHTRAIKNIVILLILWVFAAIAGLAAPVVRASIMFSIPTIGNMINKPRNIYNNIALSAFAICLFNPMCIFETGFLLSYSAVLSIVYFQPKLRNLIYIGNNFIFKIWELICVTAAAQLGTLPIILLNFKQFPSYFLFSNLVLVPFASVVMYAAIAVIFVSPFPVLLSASGYVSEFFLTIMIRIARFFENLPGSVIDGIHIDNVQCVLLGGALAFSAFFIAYRRSFALFVSAASLISFFCINVSHRYNISKQIEWGIYAVNRTSFAYFIKGNSGFCLRDSADVERKFDYYTKNHLTERGFGSERELNVFASFDSLPDSYNGVIVFADRRIGVSSELIRHIGSGDSLKLNYLLLNESAGRPDIFLSACNPDSIISVNIGRRQNELWKEAAEARGIHFTDMRASGAFVTKYR